MRHFEALMRHLKNTFCVYFTVTAQPSSDCPQSTGPVATSGWWLPVGQGRAHRRYAAPGSSETFDRWN